MQACELMAGLHDIDIHAGFDATRYLNDIQCCNSTQSLLQEPNA